MGNGGLPHPDGTGLWRHWSEALGAIGLLLLTCGGMLVGATLWIESTIRSVAEENLAAINAQAGIFAKVQADNERRLVTLEVQRGEQLDVLNRLSAEVEKIAATEEALSRELQRLQDKMRDPPT
jgi:uncharacterized coiled-coil protein SlyX